MKKYRARLKNGRIIGPFDLNGIKELAQKSRVSEEDEFQEFPTGDWLRAKSIPEISEILSNLNPNVEVNDDPTFVRKLSGASLGNDDAEEGLIEIEQADPNFPKEFSYDQKDEGINLKEDDGIISNDTAETEPKTELVTKMRFKEQENSDPDKTIINAETLKYLDEQKKKEEEQKILLESEETKQEVVEEALVNLSDEETRVLSLEDVKGDLEKEVVESESEFGQELVTLSTALPEKKKSKKKKEDTTDKEKKPKKKKSLFIVVACVLLLLLLMDDEKTTTGSAPKIVYPQITFPQQYETPDDKKAKLLFNQAVKLYANGDYQSKIKAANLFRSSLENKFKDNPAAGKLIFTYSELLKHSNNKQDDAVRIFKLLQVFSSQATKDADISAGTALFFLEMDKPDAAVKTIEKFNIVDVTNPTIDLFGVYLKALLQEGDLIKGAKVEKKLSEVKGKTFFTLMSLHDYYFFKGDYDKAAITLNEAQQKVGNLAEILIRKANLLLYRENVNDLEVVAEALRDIESEKSKIYYSKYLEIRGLLAVKEEKPDLALKAFKKALSINESLALRSRLATLSANSTPEANELINQSKAIQLISRSENHWKKGNIKFAFKDALEATRIAPNYLPAKIHLSKLQIKRSYFEEAIKSFEKMYKDNPHNPKVVFGLIDSYIEAYKFDKVKKQLNILATSELRQEPEYFSKMAKYFVYKDEFSGAVAWLQKAINLNPLNDGNIYELAKMFIRYRKYNQAKVLLSKAMDLDPASVDYRISYADILYETDSSNSAIGYLYDVLKDFPDNPKILSAIGIYYYRSGQVKMFKSTKKRLIELPKRDTALYEFLIQAAKIDGNFQAVVKYSKELIDINPGDLRARLFLGQVFMEMSKYEEALEQFNAIKDRLESYPKLQYYMSKLYLLTGNVKKATELAQEEVKSNPDRVDGYVLLGEIYKDQEKFIDSEKNFKMAQKLNPRNVDALVGLAYINFLRSQYEISLDLFKKAKGFEPGRAEIHKLLGDVYRKIGQSSLAVESYNMFLELSPNSRYKENLQNYIKMMQ